MYLLKFLYYYYNHLIKSNNDKSVYNFKFKFDPQPGEEIIETYVGVYISVSVYYKIMKKYIHQIIKK